MNSQIQTISVCLTLIFCIVFSGANASDDQYHQSYNQDILSDGEKMVLDAVVMRPAGLLTTIAGTAIYTISLPFSLLGGNEKQAREHLVNEPARYTFKRPLGDLEY